LASQRVQSGNAFLQPQRRQIPLFFRTGGGAVDEGMKLRGERGLGLYDVHPGPQTAHHFHPIEVGVEEPSAFFVGRALGQ
jgi:hypothetical protein